MHTHSKPMHRYMHESGDCSSWEKYRATLHRYHLSSSSNGNVHFVTTDIVFLQFTASGLCCSHLSPHPTFFLSVETQQKAPELIILPLRGSLIKCFSVRLKLNWTNHFGEKRQQFSARPVSSTARGAEGAALPVMLGSVRS